MFGIIEIIKHMNGKILEYKVRYISDTIKLAEEQCKLLSKIVSNPLIICENIHLDDIKNLDLNNYLIGDHA